MRVACIALSKERSAAAAREFGDEADGQGIGRLPSMVRARLGTRETVIVTLSRKSAGEGKMASSVALHSSRSVG